MSTPDLHLRTCYLLNDAGEIISTREPGASSGAVFTLIRGAGSCAWAVRADVPTDTANELHRFAGNEPPTSDLRAAPAHAERYISLLGERIAPNQGSATKTSESDGPAFQFPDSIPGSAGIVVVDDEQQLNHNFRGWVPGEIAAGRSPVLAIVQDGYPVSVCFCARRSDEAAEAGLDTASAYRGRGYGPRVTAAWALAIRESGRIPLYSTSWTNHASLAVARKLNLVAYASAWSLSD